MNPNHYHVQMVIIINGDTYDKNHNIKQSGLTPRCIESRHETADLNQDLTEP